MTDSRSKILEKGLERLKSLLPQYEKIKKDASQAISKSDTTVGSLNWEQKHVLDTYRSGFIGLSIACNDAILFIPEQTNESFLIKLNKTMLLEKHREISQTYSNQLNKFIFSDTEYKKVIAKHYDDVLRDIEKNRLTVSGTIRDINLAYQLYDKCDELIKYYEDKNPFMLELLKTLQKHAWFLTGNFKSVEKFSELISKLEEYKSNKNIKPFVDFLYNPYVIESNYPDIKLALHEIQIHGNKNKYISGLLKNIYSHIDDKDTSNNKIFCVLPVSTRNQKIN